MTINSILKEVGQRVRYLRISANLKQAEIAAKAAVSLDTVGSIEKGRSVNSESLFRVLKALGHEDALLRALPEPTISPVQLAKLKGKERQRVR